MLIQPARVIITVFRVCTKHAGEQRTLWLWIQISQVKTLRFHGAEICESKNLVEVQIGEIIL